MEIPFVTPNIYEGYFPINWYYQKARFNGRPCLYPTPGMLLWCDTGYYGEVRGACKLSSDYAYFVVGNKVFRSDTSGNSAECTGTLSTSTGIVDIVSDGSYVVIGDGQHGYYILGTILTQISDVDFPIPSSLAQSDGYFIVSRVGTGEFNISGLHDPTIWDGLDFTTAEGSPDKIKRIFVDHRELLVFGEDSTEPYENTGNADFPFERIAGAFIESGLAAKDAVAKMDNSVFWLSDDFMIKGMSAYTPIVISPESLAAKIKTYSRKDDAFAYSYKDNGNAFLVMTFPTADKTWVFNAATNAIHQWSSGVYASYEGSKRHRSNCHVFFAGKNLVGDMENGKIYELSDTTYTDDGETIKRNRISPPLFDPDSRFRLTYPSLEVEFESGVGLVTGQGEDPQAVLRYSDDNCKTWGNEKWRSIGKIGNYKNRAKWKLLGSSRMRNFELSITDPVKAVVVNATSPVARNMA